MGERRPEQLAFDALTPVSAVERTAVTCRHPSLEGEAATARLVAAAQSGVAWHEMAVLVRQRGRRADATERALRRHGIPVGDGGVAVIPIGETDGRSWPVVVIVGAVEGELPASRAAASPADERQLWDRAVSRATRIVCAVAAPDAGTLVSRFLDGWPVVEAHLPPAPRSSLPSLPAGPTTNDGAPVWPDSALQLSATKLATWQDCALKFAYAYPLRLRGPSNVWADFGTLVHEILRSFLDPAADHPRTRERLMELAQEHWSDEIAPYRPQREQARRELGELLELWWEHEGRHHPDVVFVEKRFEIPAGHHTVTGSIDRVSKVANGVEIVDYKTSRSSKLTKDAAEDDIQLATYHLAATKDPDIAAAGPVVSLKLLYVRDMTERRQPIRPDHAQVTERAIVAMADEILTEGFEPSVDADCRHCEYHRLCPLQDKGRMVADR